MPYTANLKDEKKPTHRMVLPEGRRNAEIVGVDYGKSKAAQPMFTFSIKDEQTGYIDKFYALDVAGKRGNLKMLLEACQVKHDIAGNFTWDNPDVIGRKVVCLIVHEPNTYINRQGDTITGIQHKIAEITPYGVNPEDIVWGE